MTVYSQLGESCLKPAMASICNDRGAGQGRAQRAGYAGRRSLTRAASGAIPVGQQHGSGGNDG